MRHDWSYAWTAKSVVADRTRTCRRCGAYQEFEEISYDRMMTPKLKQAWRPLVGRCTPAKRNAKKHNSTICGESTAISDQTPKQPPYKAETQRRVHLP